MTGNFRPGKTVVKGHSLHLSLLLSLARSLASLQWLYRSCTYLRQVGYGEGSSRPVPKHSSRAAKLPLQLHKRLGTAMDHLKITGQDRSDRLRL